MIGAINARQSAVPEFAINHQVIDILCTIEIPVGFQERVQAAVQERVENEVSLRRMEDIRAIADELDFRWGHGFISKEGYLTKLEQLQFELTALRPVQIEHLVEAANLLNQFRVYWRNMRQWKNLLLLGSS